MENVGDFEGDEVAGLEFQARVLMQSSFRLFTKSVRDEDFGAQSRKKNMFFADQEL